MSKTALLITHRALLGNATRFVVSRKSISNPTSLPTLPIKRISFDCYDDGDSDTICVFQQYVDGVSSQDFLAAPWYAAYVNDVTPILAGQPEIRAATPVWIKGNH